MKSIQFNYFASNGDLMTVATTVLEWCPQLVLFPPRGTGCVLQGTAVRDPVSLIPSSSGEKQLLCSSDNAYMVRTTIVDARISCIDIAKNPVIEYSPSAPSDANIVKIGRFYANYDDADFIKRVKKLFRQLERRAIRLDDSGVWIFPSAARTKRTLKMWAGKDWENPFVINAS